MAAPLPPSGPAWLSFVHPAIATIGLALAFLAVQRGLTIREARTRKQPYPPNARQDHLGLARPAVIVLAIAFLGGVGSAIFVRHFKPFDSTHGWLGAAAISGFVGTGLIGTRLVKNFERQRGWHVAFSLLGLGAGLLAALTGISMLP